MASWCFHRLHIFDKGGLTLLTVHMWESDSSVDWNSKKKKLFCLLAKHV